MIRDLQFGKGLAKTKTAHSGKNVRHKVFSIFCLVILLFYLMRPALPYFEYLLLKDYISKNLCIEKDKPDNCCQGKCFLEEQLKKNVDPIDADRNSDKKISHDKKIDDHLLTGVAVNKLVEEKILKKRFYSEQISDAILTPVFIPPKFC